jgi:hypothetical protein
VWMEILLTFLRQGILDSFILFTTPKSFKSLPTLSTSLSPRSSR